MEKIKKFMLPEHTNTLYEKEAISSISLTKEVAEKINELIAAYNELSATDLEWKQTQEGSIRKGILYMKDNLLNSIQELLDNVGIKLIVSTVEDHMETLVDKRDPGTITLSMLSQAVREAMTGGSVAVVGEDAVSTANIVNGSVSESKLYRVLMEAVCYISPMNHNRPLLFIDKEALTVTKRAYNGNLIITTKGGESWNLPFSNTTINKTNWSGNSSFELLIDVDNNIIYIVDLGTRNGTLNQCVYGGMVSSNVEPRSLIIPVEYNGGFIPAKHITTSMSLAKVNKMVGVWEKKEFFSSEDCYFNLDSETGTITTNPVQGKFVVNDSVVTVNFGSVAVQSGSIEGDYVSVFYNAETNTLIFNSPTTGNFDNFDNCYYLGIIATNPDSIHNSSTVLAYTIDNIYIYYPNKTGRENSMLNVAFVRSYGSNIIPTVDFTGRKLIIPPHSAIHAMYKNRYIAIGGSSTESIEIPFTESTNYQYLVGGYSGLKFVDSAEFNASYSKYDITQGFYFGFINETLKKVNFSFECGKAKTLSIMGDSISTFTGYIPSGNAAYYDGTMAGISQVNETWWKRAIGELGYTLNTNNSWSGSTVSQVDGITAGAGTSGIERAALLDNGESPDIILTYIGINDFNRGCPLVSFENAYGEMLSAIEREYKQSRVYVMTLPPCQRNLDNVEDPEYNRNGDTLVSFNEAIRRAAQKYNTGIIETEKCGITNFNGNIYMGDYDSGDGGFLHPNASGHKLIADCVIKNLK